MLRSRRRGRELSAELKERRDRHRNRAMPLIDALEREYVESTKEMYHPSTLSPLKVPAGEALKKQPDEVLVSVFVTALTQGHKFVTGELLTWLQRKRLPFEAPDVEIVLTYAIARERNWWFLSKLAPAVSAAQQLPEDEVESLRPLLEKALKAIDQVLEDPQATRVRAKLHEMLATSGEIDLALFDKGDEWGKKMRRLAKRFSGEPGIAELLLHFAKATSARPTERWRKANVERLAAAPRGEGLVKKLLDEVLGTDVIVRSQFEFEGEVFYDYVFLGDANSTIARGAIWSLLDLDDAWRPGLLERLLAVSLGNSHKLANACIYVLGELGDAESLTLLARTRAKVSDKSVLKQVEKALGSAAEQAGLTKWQLRERLVPDIGGRSEVPFGKAVATLEVEPPGKVSVTWAVDGKSVRSVPATVKEEFSSELAALKRETKEVRDAVGVERRRLEELFVDDASWPLDEWRERYLGHELTRSLAQTLIWTFESKSATRAGLPLQDEGVVGADGASFKPDAKAVVRLWHPIEKPVEEVAAWRSFLLERELGQPFKQAYREVYPLAPAERQTGVYSNRFAAHIVRYPQTYALMKSRHWSVVALGPYDNDGGRNTRDFETAGIRAEFWLEEVPVEGDDYLASLSALASSDQVRFYREREPMELADVPPLVFSEAMRDVDLFVGVSSIAGDPEWRDHGDRRFDDYWYRTSFGELTETAETRREVLEALLPRLTIGERCRIDGKFLVVNGDLRTYKIHLGSGNVLMEPNDEYLCIVSARRSSKKVFLPFEEDSVLTMIVSKAFMLAADKRIKDSTITEQIQRG